MAFPNIPKCYYAATLTACLSWWQQVEGDLNMALEQDPCSVQLRRWLTEEAPKRSDISGANKIVGILGTMWMRYKKGLVPPHSLLQRVPKGLEFSVAQLDFATWRKAAFLTLNDLLIKGQFPAFEYFSTKIKGLKIFQYNQLKSLSIN